MTISMIASIGKNNELGKGNDLIWHFKEDMKFFKETTMGHSVIMGRKTFESLPKALPGRKNIVITRDSAYSADGICTVSSPQEAIAAADTDEVFILGGGSIYNLFLPKADKLYLTEIEAEEPDADTYFPAFDKNDYTKKEIAHYDVNGTAFSHIVYEKK